MDKGEYKMTEEKSIKEALPKSAFPKYPNKNKFEKEANPIHKNSCGKVIYGKDGKFMITCGDDLGGDYDEFAQCPECRKKDYKKETLSDKIYKLDNQEQKGFLYIEPVKEFIKKLKEELCYSYTRGGCKNYCAICHGIDKLAGEKLIGKPVNLGRGC
jgi:hypothetical protein